MIEYERNARIAQDGARVVELVALALHLDQPAHLANLREKRRHRGLVQHADAVGDEIEAYSDHPGVVQLRQRTRRSVRTHTRDALEAAAGGAQRGHHAAIVVEVAARRVDQHGVRKAVRIEYRGELFRGAGLVRRWRVGRAGRIGKARNIEDVTVRIDAVAHESPHALGGAERAP